VCHPQQKKEEIIPEKEEIIQQKEEIIPISEGPSRAAVMVE